MPVRSLRPSFEAFKRAEWYPASQEVYDLYLEHLAINTHKTMKLGDDGLLPSVKAFKDFVDATPTVYQEFIRMFAGIAKSESVSFLPSVESNGV